MMESAAATGLQATPFDFAIVELVSQHRESFKPLWTVDSWVKMLIWLSLNCGCRADEEGMKTFADSIGSAMTARMRRVFFRREFHDLQLQLMGDPAEKQILVLPMEPEVYLDMERAAMVIERVHLNDRVVTDRSSWNQLESLVAVPWSKFSE